MKILCIISNGPRNDGITNNVLLYYKSMDRSNIQVDMLKTRDVDSGLEEKITTCGVRLCFTCYRKNVLGYIVKTTSLVRKEKYDIVHVHGSSGLLAIELLAAYLGGCKIRIAHSRNTTCNHRKIDALLRPLFYRLCTERFACGNDAGKWLFGKQEFHVINNGKDLSKFAFSYEIRSEIRKARSWENFIMVGHVGNFNFQKNHEFLIDVFYQLQKKKDEYRLVLIGDGDEYYEKAIEQVHKLKIENKVLFMGSITNVSDVLQAMDIMLLPSRFEGLPNVVLEWQISGLPSLISDKITRECKVTELVDYLSIEDGVDEWVKRITEINIIEDRTVVSESACKDMRQAGFDIVDNAKMLKDMYIEMCRKVKYD